MDKGILNEIKTTSLNVGSRMCLEQLEKIRPDFKNCGSCYSPGTPVGTVDDRMCVVLQCSSDTCQMGWAACAQCGTGQKKRIESLEQWRRHKRNAHNKKREKALKASKKGIREDAVPLGAQRDIVSPDVLICDTPLPTFEDTIPIVDESFSFSTPPKASVIFGQSNDHLQDIKWIECGHRGDDLGLVPESSSALHFQQCFLASSESGGIEHLAKRSMIRAELTPTAYRDKKLELPPGHALLELQMAELAFGMTPTEKQRLVRVMDGCQEVGKERGIAWAKMVIGGKFHRLMSRKDIEDHKTPNELAQPNFINDIFHRKGPELELPACTNWSARIPKDVNEIRNNHLDGKHSIVRCLPHPAIKTDVPGHSYVSIIECIRHFLAHEDGRRLATIPKLASDAQLQRVTHPSVSKRAQELLLQLPALENALKGYVFFWSDDVEPNRLSKAGRGSVWVATMTVGAQPGDSHNLHNTYPIAIGRKGESHDAITERIEKEMKLLRSGQTKPFYVGALKKQVMILFSEMAHLADQPERRGFNYLRLGGRGFSARFGVSANHKDCYGAIRACDECVAHNKGCLYEENHAVLPPPCDKCMNWDVLAEGNLGLSDPPKHYPLLPDVEDADDPYANSLFCRLVRVNDHTNKNTCQKIKPFRIMYASLRGAVELAHDCYCNHGWSSNNVAAYLQVEGLNDDFITKFMQHASRCYSLNIARCETQENATEDSEHHKTILTDALRFPEKYRRIPFPPAWTREGFELTSHPDVIMHMMFLGIVENTMQLIQSWLKATKQNAAFIRANASKLDPLTKLDVQWINTLRYSGEGFGHWVSENYLGFARVMPWFYQNIADVAPETFELPPANTQRTWSKKHNEYWLRCRGLQAEGRAEDLRRQVAQLMEMPDPPEVIQEPQRRVEDVQELLMALYVLLECVMSTKVERDTIKKMRCAVRVFLSSYDALSASVTGRLDASIFGAYNFACLMNLPEAMEQFGPLRQLWEGSTKGEGFLWFVKPMMTQGFKHHNNWHYHLLHNLSIAKAFDNIRPHTEMNETIPGSNKGPQLRRGMFQKHKSVYDFQRDLEALSVDNKKPISIVLVRTQVGYTEILAVVDTYDKVMRISCLKSLDAVKKFGLHYYRFEVLEGYQTRPWSDFSEKAEEIGYGMLLPLLGDGPRTIQKFALVASNWRALGPNTTLSDLVDSCSAAFD